MAAKKAKAAKKTAAMVGESLVAAAAAPAKSDADIILDAYADSLKDAFNGFVLNLIDAHGEAESRFLNALRLNRQARDRAIVLVQQ